MNKECCSCARSVDEWHERPNGVILCDECFRSCIWECYACKKDIDSDVDNWQVVNTAMYSYVMCEDCVDQETGPVEEDEDIDMSALQNALNEVAEEQEEQSDKEMT
jgi:hypothetical protein